MREYEQVKLFSGENTSDVEKQFNDWVISKEMEREENPVLSGFPLTITSRELTIRNYEGDETFALAVFYRHRELEPHERGSIDRGSGGGTVLSMIAGRR